MTKANQQAAIHVHSVYQTVVFVLVSMVFGLIGLELPEPVRATGHPGALARGGARGDRYAHCRPGGVGFPIVGGLPVVPWPGRVRVRG